MIKIAICDDNLSSLKYTSKVVEAQLINLEFEAEIVLTTQNQEEVKDMIKNNEIDVLLLSIDFKGNGKNGIEFATELREIDKYFYLIFVTSFFEYSLIAYQCKTFGYVLKPITPQSILPIFARLKSEFFKNTSKFLHFNKSDFIRTDDILFIERNKSKAKVYTVNDVIETSYSLKSIQELLPESFVRIHRSYIVNLSKIQRIDKNGKTILFGNKLSCPLGQLRIY